MNAVLQRRLAHQATAIWVKFPDPALISINVSCPLDITASLTYDSALLQDAIFAELL
jgi:hypothetical protein